MVPFFISFKTDIKKYYYHIMKWSSLNRNFLLTKNILLGYFRQKDFNCYKLVLRFFCWLSLGGILFFFFDVGKNNLIEGVVKGFGSLLFFALGLIVSRAACQDGQTRDGETREEIVSPSDEGSLPSSSKEKEDHHKKRVTSSSDDLDLSCNESLDPSDVDLSCSEVLDETDHRPIKKKRKRGVPFTPILETIKEED